MTKEERKEAILQKQMEMAMNGSVDMLKWLGVQYCGQSNQPQADKDDLPSGFDIRLYDDVNDKYVDMVNKDD